ncbi:MAG: DUF1499 domain-containing protein [Motiliproteus sp.]
MKLLSILTVAVVGSLLAVIVLFVVKAIDSKQGEAAGLVNQQLSQCSRKPNCVNSERGAPSDKKVQPLPLSTGVDDQSAAVQDWQRLQQSVTELGGELVRVDNDYLAATFTSSLFGFVDDVEARLDSAAGVIQIRSGSRVGTSDFGANRQRVELIRQRYLALKP